VLRVRTNAGPTFRELVRRARVAALGAFEHQELPFEKLVEAIQPPRDLRHNPIFQVNFRVQSQPPDVLHLPGVAIEDFPLDIGFARFDLAIEFQLREDGIGGYLEYNEALLNPGTVRRLGSRLTALLRDGLARPDEPIDELNWGDGSAGARGIRGRGR
jgi:non-ribosomal peptide synthetase component F